MSHYPDYTYTQKEVDRLRSQEFVTDNGVVFDEAYYTIDGCKFVLIKEAHTTMQDINEAKHYLRSERDVIGRIEIGKIQD